jgi:acetyl esterase/lipase
MNGVAIILGLAGIAGITVAVAPEQVIYGKYFSLDGEKRSYADNTYYLYMPPKNLNTNAANPEVITYPTTDTIPYSLVPIVVHFYGCGWRNCGGPWTQAGHIVGDLLRHGIAVASVGYRRITTTYWYDNPAAENKRSPEELIHVDANGVMTLDTQGRTMKDYEVRICRHEFITKSLFDARTALDRLMAYSLENGIDLNRLVFWAYSAGGSLAQYLTHVYHQWNEGAYTPLGMVYRSSMLDLPTANLLDRAWYLIGTDTVDGEATRIKDLINQEDCWWVVGNGCSDPRFDRYLEPNMPYKICNDTWEKLTLDRYCGSSFDTATVGELKQTQRWPREDPDVGAGMQKLWYASDNMRKHTPRPFYVFLENLKKENYGLLHSSLYLPSFKRFFNEAGIYFTAYYDDHPQMKDFAALRHGVQPTSPEEIIMADGHAVKYDSNHGWRDLLRDAGFHARVDTEESISYACFVLSQPGCSPQLASDEASSRKLVSVKV